MWTIVDVDAFLSSLPVRQAQASQEVIGVSHHVVFTFVPRVSTWITRELCVSCNACLAVVAELTFVGLVLV